MASLKEIVVKLREDRGLSTTELARQAGITQPSMHNIESGKTKNLRGPTLVGLCRALNVSPEVLLGKRRPPPIEAVLQEAELLTLWRTLSDENRKHLLATARAFATKPRPDKPGRPLALPPPGPKAGH